MRRLVEGLERPLKGGLGQWVTEALKKLKESNHTEFVSKLFEGIAKGIKMELDRYVSHMTETVGCSRRCFDTILHYTAPERGFVTRGSHVCMLARSINFKFMESVITNVVKHKTSSYRYPIEVQALAAAVSVVSKQAMQILTGPGGAATGTREVAEALK